MEVIRLFKIILWFWDVRALGEAGRVRWDHNGTAWRYFGLALAAPLEQLFAGKRWPLPANTGQVPVCEFAFRFSRLGVGPICSITEDQLRPARRI
jgi:hypothetical protein